MSIRRIILVIFFITLAWHLIEVLQHRSDNPLIFERYSPAYFSWVLFYGLFFAVWTSISVYAFFWWDRLTLLLQQVGRDRVKSSILWIFLPLLWVFMLAWVMMVDRTASYTTPHSAAVPLLLLAVANIVIVAYLTKFSQVGELKIGSLSLMERLIVMPILRRFDIAAHWLSQGLHGTFTALAVITLTVIMLFAPVLLSPSKVISGSDLQAQYYIVEQYTARTMRDGKLPFWNPYLFSGTPQLARPDTMTFYPSRLILRYLLPVNVVIALEFALHVWIAGAGMYLFCRYLKLRPWIALTCALAFMMNGGLLTRIAAGHVWLVSLAWLPLAWLFVSISLERGSIIAIVAASLVLAMVILGGHPAYPGYILLFMGFFWLYHAAMLWQKDRSVQSLLISGVRFISIIIMAIGLAAIQLIPAAVFSSQSSLSAGYDIAYANVGALLPLNLTMIFIPDAFPQPTQAIWEQMPYLGILLPLVALWAYSLRQYRQLAIFLGLVAALSVLLAFGHEVRVFSLLYYFFPPFRVIRVPPRALVMWIPSVIVLGGLGLQALAERIAKEEWVAWGSYLCRSATVIPIGVLAGYLLAKASGANAQVLGLMRAPITAAIIGMMLLAIQLKIRATLYPPSSQFSRMLPSVALFAVSATVGFVLLPQVIPVRASSLNVVLGFGKLAIFLLAISILLPSVYRFAQAPLIPLLIVLLTFVDLYTFGRKYITVSEIPSFDIAEKQALQVIPRSPNGRIMDGDAPPGSNDFMPLGISNIDGHYSGMLASYATYLRGVAANPPGDTIVLLSNTSYPEIDERALDFLNVTHVLSRKPLSGGRELVARAPEYLIYRNPDALPRAFWVSQVRFAEGSDAALQAVMEPSFDYRTTVVLEEQLPVDGRSVSNNADVEIVEYDEARGAIVIRTHTSQAGVLVMSEPYYSERRAWLDGEKVPLLKANVAFSAVVLPAGSHQVKIDYVPDSVSTGAAITLVTLIFSLGLALFSLTIRRVRNRRL